LGLDNQASISGKRRKLPLCYKAYHYSGAIHSSIQLVQKTFSEGLQRPEGKDDHPTSI
jgi:hypothetical protein